MDFVPLIDSLGEPGAAVAIGAGLGLIFGFAAERSGFCTRTAINELITRQAKNALPTWLIAFAVAVFGVQLLLTLGHLDVTETRFFSTPQSLSGALIGGVLFGVGMALARGCASRLLILGASGNLRAITTSIVLAATAWATYDGFLAPARDAISAMTRTTVIGGNDLVSAIGLSSNSGIVIGLVLAIFAIGAGVRSRLSLFNSFAGVSIGAVIVGGWYLTYQFSTQLFEPVQAESLSFIRPYATTINLVASGGAEKYLSIDVGIIGGTILGAILSSVLFGSFKIRTFSDAGTPHILRYVAGGILMGFGGILAVGCTIGAGFTGGSVLAISSLLGLASMIAGSAITQILLNKYQNVNSKLQTQAIPAE